jgi:hypothetical protein
MTPQMLRGLVQYVTSIQAGVQKLSVRAKLLVGGQGADRPLANMARTHTAEHSLTHI